MNSLLKSARLSTGLFTTAFLVVVYSLNAQNYQWAFEIGGTGVDWGLAISTDTSGNVLVTGTFQGTADFDPSGNTTNLTANGPYDIFVAKYDSAGNYLWAFNVGGTSLCEGWDITTDPAGSGDMYITGRFAGTADFDPSGNTANLISNGASDIFIAKYDANGNYLWAFSVGETGTNWGNGITAGSGGNVYITGTFSGTADFDPSGNTANLTSNGSTDIYIAKYDAFGNYLWAFNVGGSSAGSDYGLCITTDPTGNGDVYVAGWFADTVDFDPSGNTANLIANVFGDVFVSKYDAAGNYLWAFNMGGTNIDVAYGITTGPAGSGDVYVTGYFEGTTDFDPSGNIANLTSNAFSNDVYVAKYDANGNYLWAFNMGGTASDFGYDIAADPAGSGDVYVTGIFSGTADFDPSGNTANLTSNGDLDIFISRYDANGNYLWAFNVGGTAIDQGVGVTTGPGGNVYVTGSSSGTADFDPSGNTANLTSNGLEDIFIARYYSPTTIGINSFTTDESYLISPNPTTGKFEVTSLELGVGEVQVFDLLGNLVLATPKREIDLSSHPAGIYIVKVGERTEKLVLSK